MSAWAQIQIEDNPSCGIAVVERPDDDASPLLGREVRLYPGKTAHGPYRHTEISDVFEIEELPGSPVMALLDDRGVRYALVLLPPDGSRALLKAWRR